MPREITRYTSEHDLSKLPLERLTTKYPDLVLGDLCTEHSESQSTCICLRACRWRRRLFATPALTEADHCGDAAHPRAMRRATAAIGAHNTSAAPQAVASYVAVRYPADARPRNALHARSVHISHCGAYCQVCRGVLTRMTRGSEK